MCEVTGWRVAGPVRCCDQTMWPSADLIDYKVFEQVVKPAISKQVRDSLLRRQLITYYELNASTIMPNTSVLWGRGVIQVQCGATGALALTETGEVFAWGGTEKVRCMCLHFHD